jgi:GT2 family glycosyltransferase
VIDEVGGFDPRYGLGNFEDDDLCIRVRAAGYEIAVCHDSFIHHFGSASFNANGLSYDGILQTNSAAFLKRWDLAASACGAWDALPAIRRGFVRERDYVPLPAPEPVGAEFTLGSWR